MGLENIDLREGILLHPGTYAEMMHRYLEFRTIICPKGWIESEWEQSNG